MKLDSVIAAGFAAMLALGMPSLAAADDAPSARELENARKEVERAREELRRTTRELARSLARVEKDNPRAQYFSHITDPDRPMLGIIIGDEKESRDERGLQVLAVTPGGGADKAGLKAGDLILGVNGKPLAATDREPPRRKLLAAMDGVKAGDRIKLEYERDGKRHTTSLVTQRPDPDAALAQLGWPHMLERELDFEFDSMMPRFHFRGPAVRGLQLARLDDDLAHYFKTRDGVLVIRAPKDNPLELHSGDVIQKIDGQTVSEPVTVLDLLHRREGKRTVTVEVLRRGKSIKLSGQLPVAKAGMHPDRRIEKRRVKVIVDDDG